MPGLPVEQVTICKNCCRGEHFKSLPEVFCTWVHCLLSWPFQPSHCKTTFETCVLSTLLYGAENWILDDVSLNHLEGFQAEIRRLILQLSRFHSRFSVLLGLSWSSMPARVLMLKLGFLHSLLFYECDDLASQTFHTLASQDIYSIRIVLQYLSLESKLGTKSVATIINSNDPSPLLTEDCQKVYPEKR